VQTIHLILGQSPIDSGLPAVGTGEGPGLGLERDRGTQRVGLDIPAEHQEVTVILHRKALEAAEEKDIPK
jgi:hypothetical protein